MLENIILCPNQEQKAAWEELLRQKCVGLSIKAENQFGYSLAIMRI